MTASLTTGMIDLACKAGARILEIYNTDFEAATKEDGSAITEADGAAEKIILDGLAALAPDIPVLAEEAAAEGKIPELGDRFFLVDPLDGTREFVNRTGEFTVNIALVAHGKPVAGVVFTPVTGRLFWGDQDGAFAATVTDGVTGEAETISVRRVPAENLTAVASRSHRTPETDELLEKLGARDFTPAGSSLKFCLVAEGKADVYPRLGRTMEWDTGAGQAVLEAAGGSVHALNERAEEGEPLAYGKKGRGFDNPHFIAWGGR